MTNFRAYYITLSSTLQAQKAERFRIERDERWRSSEYTVPVDTPAALHGQYRFVYSDPTSVVKHRSPGLSLAAFRPGSSLDSRFTTIIGLLYTCNS